MIVWDGSKSYYNEHFSETQNKTCRCATAVSQQISCISAPKCVNNICKLVADDNSLCNSLIYSNCKMLCNVCKCNNESEDINQLNGDECKSGHYCYTECQKNEEEDHIRSFGITCNEVIQRCAI